MKSKFKEQTKEVMVKIHGLSFFEGQGVGRSDDGKVYFVDLACPGDVVLVKPYKENSKFAFASIIQLIEASPQRVQPPCSVFGRCGGCSIQHVDYQVQLQQKQFVLERYHSKKPHFDLEPIEPAEKQYFYRNRMEVHVEKGHWGLYQKKSHHLVFPKDCKIVDETINSYLESDFTEDGHYHIDHKGVTQRTRGTEGVFDQVNPEINLKLKNYLLELVKTSTYSLDSIFDLYAGSGNYSHFLSEQLPELNFKAVELSRQLVEKGRTHSKNKGKIEWICSDVTAFIQTIKTNELDKSLFLVNPPRNGLDKEFVSVLNYLKPRSLIYVSCNPMTLFRDIDALSPSWSLKKLKGFDMFPQTMHFESVALLTSNR